MIRFCWIALAAGSLQVLFGVLEQDLPSLRQSCPVCGKTASAALLGGVQEDCP